MLNLLAIVPYDLIFVGWLINTDVSLCVLAEGAYSNKIVGSPFPPWLVQLA